MNGTVESSFKKLEQFCSSQSFRGWDPYDGLNSPLLRPLIDSRLSRFFKLAFIQLIKKSPLNMRPLLGIEKEHNPKGLALFLSGYCTLYKISPRPEILNQIHSLSRQIILLRSKSYSNSCWGYNFDWQSLSFFLPKWTPTVVATSYVGNALLDAYELTHEKAYLEHALSAGNFVMSDLNHSDKDESGFCLSYSPLDHSVVYNASLLGARLMSRLGYVQKDQTFINWAKPLVTYVLNKQKTDGSWVYGKANHHQWIDSFHTGFVLECLWDFQKYSAQNFSEPLQLGLNFYCENFFLEDGAPKYYTHKTYPIDIHAPAQLLITLIKMEQFQKKRELIDKVMNWTRENMQDEQGYFYFQKQRYLGKVKIPYMRWAQGWMFLSLAMYLWKEKNEKSLLS